jgi:hypothetical protein
LLLPGAQCARRKWACVRTSRQATAAAGARRPARSSVFTPSRIGRGSPDLSPPPRSVAPPPSVAPSPQGGLFSALLVSGRAPSADAAVAFHPSLLTPAAIDAVKGPLLLQAADPKLDSQVNTTFYVHIDEVRPLQRSGRCGACGAAGMGSRQGRGTRGKAEAQLREPHFHRKSAVLLPAPQHTYVGKQAPHVKPVAGLLLGGLRKTRFGGPVPYAAAAHPTAHVSAANCV